MIKKIIWGKYANNRFPGSFFYCFTSSNVYLNNTVMSCPTRKFSEFQVSLSTVSLLLSNHLLSCLLFYVFAIAFSNLPTL